MQAFTFYASDDKLDNRGNTAGAKYSGSAINREAARLATQVSNGVQNGNTIMNITTC